jgi:hypothetical protein
MSFARFRHVARPQFEGATSRPLRGVNGPAAQGSRSPAVGAVRGPSECESLNIKKWLKAPRSFSRAEAASRDFLARQTVDPYGEADVRWEETGMGTGGARRGRGPGTCTRIVEITSGRTTLPAGARGNLQRPATDGTTGGGERGVVRRMSQYERRRSGNADRGDARRLPAWSNSPLRAKVLSVGGGRHGEPHPGFDPACGVPSCSGVELGIKPSVVGVYASERLSHPADGKGPWGNATAANRTRETRPSGMRGRPGETWPMRNWEPMPCRLERDGDGNPPLPDARAPDLSDPSVFPTETGDRAPRQLNDRRVFRRHAGSYA